MSAELTPPPRVQFFREASGLFLGHLERNASRASGQGFEFKGHLLYDRTSLPGFLLTVAGLEIDELQMDFVTLLDEHSEKGTPERFSGINVTANAFNKGQGVTIDSASSYMHAVSIVAGNERLPTAVPYEDAKRNDFSRGQMINDEQCVAILGLMQRAEADIYDRNGKHINRA